MTAKGVAQDRDRLARLLKVSGSALDPDGVAELVAGVLAASPEIGTSWHVLVADPTPPALADALEQYRAWLAEDWRDGLATGGFRAAASPGARRDAARGIGGARSRRLHRAARRRAPGRIRAGATSGWPGSPASPARPASRSCSPDRAAVFVDGRYTLQVRDQVDPALFEIRASDRRRRRPTGSKPTCRSGARHRLRPVAAHRRTAVERLRPAAERAGAS